MTGGHTAHFVSKGEASRSPLAVALFSIEGVAGVFLGSDFITVTKGEAADWNHLRPYILGAIMDGFLKGLAVIDDHETGSGNDAAAAQEEGIFDPKDAEIVLQIKELIETRVRPAVAQDGGDIRFHGFQAGVVTLHMQGSCAGCPSSTATLKNGIENMLKHYVPEVTSVVSYT